jgi:hypothetical protein
MDVAAMITAVRGISIRNIAGSSFSQYTAGFA